MLQLRYNGRLLLIAYEALAGEVLEQSQANGWNHMDPKCLATICHNKPNKIVPAVKAIIKKHKSEYAETFIMYTDYGTGG